jgi:enolase
LDFQEFMIVPIGPRARRGQKLKKPFAEQVRMGAEVFHELGYVLKEAGFDTDVGNEGGYAPDIYSSVQAIELIMAAIVNAGYEPGRDIVLGMDVGSSELYNPQTKKYIFKLDRAQFRSVDLIGLYLEWHRRFPLYFIEDGLAEDDWAGWRELTAELGDEIMLIGDDLFVTNINRLRRGLKERAANAILIKLNQVGTLTETIECVKLAQKHNYKIMVSHRSGETCDDFIADLAVAVGADFIKSGSLSRGERLAKYNRLMEIEEEITI